MSAAATSRRSSAKVPSSPVTASGKPRPCTPIAPSSSMNLLLLNTTPLTGRCRSHVKAWSPRPADMDSPTFLSFQKQKYPEETFRACSPSTRQHHDDLVCELERLTVTQHHSSSNNNVTPQQFARAAKSFGKMAASPWSRSRASPGNGGPLTPILNRTSSHGTPGSLRKHHHQRQHSYSANSPLPSSSPSRRSNKLPLRKTKIQASPLTFSSLLTNM
jgi:hypothetical protein